MRHYHKNKAAIWRPVVNVDKLAVRPPTALLPTRTRTHD